MAKTKQQVRTKIVRRNKAETMKLTENKINEIIAKIRY
jgi:hypothetical protein